MQVVRKIDDVISAIDSARDDKKIVGFVPTMGYLHEGHLSLVEESGKFSDFQVMSIFVNKKQFNDIKDFETYPTNIENDLKLAENNGVDLIFIPDDNEMYRDNCTTVNVEKLYSSMCGNVRPGHFEGVCTIVAKLFNIIRPDFSIFGQKDIQQAIIIEKMVDDLNFRTKIIIAPIVREDNGLALSSRNKHLSREEYERAEVLNRSLQMAEKFLIDGEKGTSEILKSMRNIIDKGKPEKIDYISAVRYSDLSDIESFGGKSIIGMAAYFGSTRLIDNMIVEFDEGRVRCIY